MPRSAYNKLGGLSSPRRMSQRDAIISLPAWCRPNSGTRIQWNRILWTQLLGCGAFSQGVPIHKAPIMGQFQEKRIGPWVWQGDCAGRCLKQRHEKLGTFGTEPVLAGTDATLQGHADCSALICKHTAELCGQGLNALAFFSFSVRTILLRGMPTQCRPKLDLIFVFLSFAFGNCQCFGKRAILPLTNNVGIRGSRPRLTSVRFS